MSGPLTAPICLTFPHSKDELRRIAVRDDFGEYALYRISPSAKDWPAEAVPDQVNPRSHDMKSLTGKVAADIEATIREQPQDFWLANRGGFLLADRVKFSPETQKLSIWLTDLETHGMADGATTNAVIAKLRAELSETGDEILAEALAKARFNVDVVVGLTEHERIGRLVQGRNRSVAVKEWSLADFDGSFDWLKTVVDRRGGPFRGKIGWEENSQAPVSVLDLISILTLFHPIYDGNGGRRRAPTAAFSSKGTADKRLLDSKMADGYRSLRGVLEQIIELHDHVHVGFGDAYIEFNRQEHGRGSKLGRRRGAEPRPTVLSLTGQTCDYRLEKGLVFPLLASMRCLLRFDAAEATWRTSPFEFFDEFGFELIGRLFAEYEKLRNNPAAVGKNSSVYETLYEKAQLSLMTRGSFAAE